MSDHYMTTEKEISLGELINLYGEEPLLSPEEVVELSKRIKQGDAEARDMLIRSNIRLVISIANNYKGKGLPLEDLVQEGSTGLIKAAEKYDHAYGTMFSTYAYDLIKYAIINALEWKSRMIRLPSQVNRVVSNYNKVVEQLGHELGRAPAIREIAERMSVSEDEVEEIIQLDNDAISLDKYIEPDEEKKETKADVIKDNNAELPEETMESKMLRKHLLEFIKKLPEKAQKVITLRFGLDGGKPMTLEEISKVLSISKERVRQIEAEALRRLKENGKLRRTLEDFLES